MREEFSHSWECTSDSFDFTASRSGKNFKDNASLKTKLRHWQMRRQHKALDRVCS